MRPIRYVEEAGVGNVIEKQSLEAVKGLWNEWEIHCLILVSFGLQVFLFFFAGMRRRVVSPLLRSLLWLAYLAASSVAIFVLGHLAVHASGPRHQLLFFWAPFTLLHLGGPDSITAFSRQDSELWRRHLLGLVSQVVVAGYVVSRSSWHDRRLLAAMVIMFLLGSYKYAELTLCLYCTDQARMREQNLRPYRWMVHDMVQLEMFPSGASDIELKMRFGEMLKIDGRQPPIEQYLDDMLVVTYDSPPNEILTIVGADSLPSLLQMLKSSANRWRAYDYASARLNVIYECFYTKVYRRSLILSSIGDVPFLPSFFSLLGFLLPFLSILTVLVLFMTAEKGQQYSSGDVIVSYILLIGAVILEVVSLFTSMISCYFAVTGRRLTSHVDNYIHPVWRRRKQWSEMLPQYNMINMHTRKTYCIGIMSFVTEWISKNLDDKTLTHIPITEDLKKFVLDKLLDFGTGDEQNWKFSSFRGQLALQKWMCSHQEKLVSARPRTHLHVSINDVDVPTSVLIWHIATDICYSRDNTATNLDGVKQMSREISNYIMYLVFKCGVMITSSTDLLHDKALTEMEGIFGKQQSNKVNLSEKEAAMVLEAHKDGQEPASTKNPTSSSSQQISQLQLLENTMKDLDSPFLPRACAVANELNGVTGEANRWNFIAEVWLEMLYYIAPRCGATFHSEHLSTGGEFVTHIMMLMRLLGPFLPPPSGGST